MRIDTDKAYRIMKDEGYTLVIINGTEEYAGFRRGVGQLLEFYNKGKRFEGASVADKVVGKGAGFLYVLLGIKELVAGVISKPALKVLEENGIIVFYDELVDAIKNRKGDGFCPIESSLVNIGNPLEAVKIIGQVCEKLKTHNNA